MRASDSNPLTDEQIDKALQILQVSVLPPVEQEKWRQYAKYALEELKEAEIYADIARFDGSKEVRLALQAYHTAARNLLHKHKNLRAAVAKQNTERGDFADLIDPAALDRAIAVSAPRPNRNRKVSRSVKMNPYEAYGREQSPTLQFKAVEHARWLLEQRGLRAPLSKGGAWWQLARVLLGRDIDLFRQMRQAADTRRCKRLRAVSKG
jgi:hypothetical protein